MIAMNKLFEIGPAMSGLMRAGPSIAKIGSASAIKTAPKIVGATAMKSIASSAKGGTSTSGGTTPPSSPTTT